MAWSSFSFLNSIVVTTTKKPSKQLINSKTGLRSQNYCMRFCFQDEKWDYQKHCVWDLEQGKYSRPGRKKVMKRWIWANPKGTNFCVFKKKILFKIKYLIIPSCFIFALYFRFLINLISLYYIKIHNSLPHMRNKKSSYISFYFIYLSLYVHRVLFYERFCYGIKK